MIKDNCCLPSSFLNDFARHKSFIEPKTTTAQLMLFTSDKTLGQSQADWGPIQKLLTLTEILH